MFIAAKYEEMYAPEIGEWIDFFYISLKPPWYLHHPDLSLRVGRKAVNNKNSARSASLDDFRFLLGNWPGIFFSPQFFFVNFENSWNQNILRLSDIFVEILAKNCEVTLRAI